MAALSTSSELLDALRKSRLVDDARLDHWLAEVGPHTPLDGPPGQLAARMVRDGLLTQFQARSLLGGKHRRFVIAGKYRILDLLGSGGMGSVYLCEHVRLQSLVALKFLPPDKLKDPSALERFNREARVTATLNHPNIVRATDVDQDGQLHFLVMEYVDGASLQQIVTRVGPLDAGRAADAGMQAALGLEAAHQQGWVHRDIKPGNILLARDGTVKVLDLGLARLFGDAVPSITAKFDEKSILGTADYLAPEQSIDSSTVDIRADIYALGCTLYFVLAGRAPFQEGTVAQKLVWHSTREPDPLEQYRPDLPAEFVAVVARMMAKQPDDRYPTPAAVADALSQFVPARLPVPPTAWLPTLGPALSRFGTATADGPRSVETPRAGLTGPVTPSASGVSRPGSSSVRVAHTPRPPSGLHSQVTLPPTPAAPTASAAPRTTSAAIAPTSPRKNTRVWLTAALTAAALIVSAGGAWWWLANGTPTVEPSKPDLDKALTMLSPSGRFPIMVARMFQGRPPTVIEAMPLAKEGDLVLIHDREHSATLEIDGTKSGKGVIIQGSNAGGELPVWKPGDKTPAGKPMLRLVNVERLTIKDVILDGEDRVDDLVEVVGKCPGLRLENVTLRGYRQRGLVLVGGGESDDHVTLRKLRFKPDPARGVPKAALAFAPVNGSASEHVDVQEVRFDGGCECAVRFEGPTRYVLFTRNRFHRTRIALHYPSAQPAPALRLTLENNTFADIEEAVRLDAVPPSDGNSRLAIKGNLFCRTKAFARVEGVADAAWLRDLFPAGQNVCDMNSGTEGSIGRVQAKPTVFDPLPDNPDDDRTFLRWPTGSPLAEAGPSRSAVGIGQE